MGKKANKRKPAKKQKAVLQKNFICLFCAHENSIDIKVDKEDRIGYLVCKVCGVSFECPVHNLSAPIDVYVEWGDQSEAVNKQQKKVTEKSTKKSGNQAVDDEDLGLDNNITMADLVRKASKRNQKSATPDSLDE